MKILTTIYILIPLSYAADFEVNWSTVRARDIRLPYEGEEEQPFERIVGGEQASRHSIPYQVGIVITTNEGTFFCGGSLISTLYVLTAAHCLDGALTVHVRLGAHRINDDEPTQVRINASRWRQHERWDTFRLRNDIAVIELDEEVITNGNIQLVSLPRRSQTSNSFAGRIARISGWGRDSDSANGISPVLRQVSVSIIRNFVCNILYLGFIRNTHLCTSGSGRRGACSGDSGGPLVVNNTQIGIVSFGLGLGCEIGWPSAFTRVTSFLDWIEANTDVIIQE